MDSGKKPHKPQGLLPLEIDAQRAPQLRCGYSYPRGRLPRTNPLSISLLCPNSCPGGVSAREELSGGHVNPRHFETRKLLQYLASLSIGLFWTFMLPSNKLGKALLKPQPFCLPHPPAFYHSPNRPHLVTQGLGRQSLFCDWCVIQARPYFSIQRLTGSPDEGVVHRLDDEMEMQRILHQVFRVAPLQVCVG